MILKYLCNNFPENSVYLFVLHYEPNALPNTTFDKGLHEGGVLIRLKNGTILTSWNDVVKKSDVEYLIEDLSKSQIGFYNAGGSCYMASIIQILIHSKIFLSYLSFAFLEALKLEHLIFPLMS